MKILENFQNLKIWRKGDERAPHKPLLALYALGKVARNEGRLISFEELDQKVGQLLENFGPPRKTLVIHPFWRLQTDQIWEVEKADELSLTKSGEPKKTELIQKQIRGGFKEEVYERLRKDFHLFRAIAQDLLEKHFPESIHEDILQAVGFDLNAESNAVRRRNPAFRDRVLRAYEFRCAVCGFDMRMDHNPVCLEAAHIKWHAVGGPDEEKNGLALCTLHHKLFDRGAFTLSDGLEVLVSDRANGSQAFSDWLLKYHGKKVSAPQRTIYQPDMSFRNWHVREVFKGEVRER